MEAMLDWMMCHQTVTEEALEFMEPLKNKTKRTLCATDLYDLQHSARAPCFSSQSASFVVVVSLSRSADPDHTLIGNRATSHIHTTHMLQTPPTPARACASHSDSYKRSCVVLFEMFNAATHASCHHVVVSLCIVYYICIYMLVLYYAL